MGITFPLIVGAAFALDAVGRHLAADAAQSIKGSGRSQDWFARVIRTQPGKLSLQLSGQAPFTLLARFACEEIRNDTMFWPIFLDLQHRRITDGMSLAQAQMVLLAAKVEHLTDALTDVLSGKRAIPGMEFNDNQRRRA